MKTHTPLLFLAAASMACGVQFSDPSREFSEHPAPTGPDHAVAIHQPTTLGVADTHLVDANGTPIGVSCATCHASTEGPSMADSVTDGPLHQDVELRHGELTCDYCHDPDDRSKLRLADGSQIDFHDTMRLCGQCHGVQLRDYRNGSHGGMQGYWDLKQGPRHRNHCVDCHAPHTPAYEPMLPVHPPRDRYLEWGEH